MVISQKHIAIIDPHKNCIKPKSETSPAGTKKKLSSFFKHAGHISTFESVFGLETSKLTPDGIYNTCHTGEKCIFESNLVVCTCTSPAFGMCMK